ncbi:MAG: ATP synthase F1 subunit delta [Bacillota bacterium]|nr:ATP synthase F1 subunit delta [Bacillota bacterium]
MAELTIDITYGTALYEAARETGKTEIIMEEATEVLGILMQEPDLYEFINYPAISAAEKKRAIEKIFGGRICDELLNFICILIDKRRTMHFEKIVKVYKKFLDKEEGISYGTVCSVIPLTDERLKELEDETSKLIGANVRLTNEIDPGLIGGIRILVEGKLIDASIRKKFDDLENQIRLNQGG